MSIRTRLVVGTLALFAARLALSLLRSGPVLVADETGYLTNARVLAGGLHGQMEQAPFYRGGYSVLLAPVVRTAADPGTAYHLVLMVNAALAASLFVLLYLLLTRNADVAPRPAMWAALAGALYPPITVYSEVALSENALLPLTCGWLIAFGALVGARGRIPTMLSGLAFGACAAGLWAAHGRMLPAVVLTAGVVLRLGSRRRLDAATVAAVLLVLGVGLWATHWLDGYLIEHNYGGRSNSEAGDRLDAVAHPDALARIGANLLGQTWYLVVSTFALVVVVIGGAGRRPVPLMLLALTALLLVVSAGAFPQPTRPDMLIYGRYVEVVAPPLIALGAAMLAGSTRLPSRTLLGLGALTIVVALIRMGANVGDAANRWNVAGLPFVTAQLGPAILLGAALVAGAGAWALNRLADQPRLPVGAAAGVLFTAVVIYAIYNPLLRSEREVYPDGWTSPEPAAERAGIRSAGYDLDRYDPIGLYTLQWFLPRTSVRLFHGERQPPPAPAVISDATWGATHQHRALWRAQGRNQVLWNQGG
jgi:hypothetical protein